MTSNEDKKPTRHCEICGYVVGDYSGAALCGRCLTMSHSARMTIRSQKQLAESIDRLAKVFEAKTQKNETNELSY